MFQILLDRREKSSRSLPRLVMAAAIAAAFAPGLAAQGPKIVPPRACVAPSSPPAALRVREQPSPGDRRVRVAVVRFEESVSDDAHQHLAWAVGAHVAEALTTLPGVLVESRGTVARAWTESGARVDELARVLDADFVVTGRSAMRGDEAEITVTLWQSDAEATRWDRTFSYPSLSLRAIEDSSLVHIARYLGVRVEAARAPSAVLPAAYEAIARGDYFLELPDAAAADSARAAYARAVSSHPTSAVAKARLARSYAVLLERTGRVGRLDPARSVSEGLALADSAIRDDPLLAEAWTARAMLLRFRDPRRLTGAVEAHEKAVALDPLDAAAQHEYGETLLRLGNDRGALERFRRALAAEPGRAATLRSYAELEMIGRRFRGSCALLNASIAADEYDPLAYALRARVRLRLGEFRDAYADAEIASRLGGARWGSALSAMMLAGAGDVERAKREARQLAAAWLRGDGPLAIREAHYLSVALTLIGDHDRAIAVLTRARPQGAELRTALRDPMLDPLRRDTRFQQLVRAIATGAAGVASAESARHE